MDWIMACAMDQRDTTLPGDHFSDADYAYDVAAMKYNPRDINKNLERIKTTCSKLGLHISWAKTKVQI